MSLEGWSQAASIATVVATIVGVPAGLISAFFSLLSYFRPRQMPISATANAASGTTSGSNRGRIIPTILWGTAAIFFFVIYGVSQYHLYSMATMPLQGERGERGPQGMAGAVGPPGPPGQPEKSATTDELKPIVAALTRYIWLEEQKKQFDETSERWKTSEQANLDMIKQLISPGPLGFRQLNLSLTQASELLRRIAKTALNQDIDLTAHPNFDQNHHIPAPGADAIADQYKQEEYRREFDQFTTGVLVLTNTSNELSSKIIETEKNIATFAAKQ